jgi:4-amino-4-deoxy-L-arabinose transferase-like glycosyltransferase
LTSQLFVAATYVCVFMLGREMMDGKRALAGTLLLSGVYYTAMPSTMMNHNVAMMPFWAAIAWGIWHARKRPGPLVWMALGTLAAVSLYAKLSSALLIATGVGWIIYDARLRRQLLSPWPWAGLGLFGLLIIPLVQWLLDYHFAPVLYARESADSSGSAFKFVADQVLVAGGATLIAVFAGLISLRRSHRPVQAPDRAEPLDPAAIPFLITMMAGPVLLTAVIAMSMQTGASNKWGAPAVSLCGLLLVAISPGRLSCRMLARVSLAAVALLFVLPASFGAYTLLQPYLTGKPKRESWPQAEMSQRFQRIWLDRVGKPLRIVAGPAWEAGLVALKSGPMPSILTMCDMGASPWVTPGLLRSVGALVVWQAENYETQPLPDLRGLAGTRAVNVEQFAYPLCPRCKPLLIGYTIIPPE